MQTRANTRAGATAATRTPTHRSEKKIPLTTSREELLIDGSDRAFRELVHDLFGFLARHEEIRAGHADVIGLGGVEYTVLISIAHLSVLGDVNVKTVADHLHLSGAFITSVTRRLVGRGLVHKEVDPTDRRRVTLRVSDEGYALLEDLAPVQRQINDVEFSCLSRKDFDTLRRIVKKLIDSGDEAIALQHYLQTRTR
ncbi:MarR family winged helix-turn-helix transcriptional regulator [Microbaculum marinum]|uniref:MarR family winged helix-turn-helix transcriptional regulator n=1 Tax=Microbaculum marinum TaxID=1764581 RepID=A0AAW9RP59_9HYPH